MNQIIIPEDKNLLFSSFPGLSPKDDIIGLLKLLTAKNPLNSLAAKVALDGGYDPCIRFSGNEDFWTENAWCGPGFIPDESSGYCYKVLSDMENLLDGKRKCEYSNDAEMVLFNSNSEVYGFINLILEGKTF